MTTQYQELTDVYNNTVAALKAITANPKPDYDIDGQKVSWASYHLILCKCLKSTREELNAVAPPYEFEIEGGF